MSSFGYFTYPGIFTLVQSTHLCEIGAVGSTRDNGGVFMQTIALQLRGGAPQRGTGTVPHSQTFLIETNVKESEL